MSSAEGLWAIQFAMGEQEDGCQNIKQEMVSGGFFVLLKNRLYGGGASYFYIGTYHEDGNEISITSSTTQYNDLDPGPFGPMHDSRMLFKGTRDEDKLTLYGNVEDEPDKKFTVVAIRRHDINIDSIA